MPSGAHICQLAAKQVGSFSGLCICVRAAPEPSPLQVGDRPTWEEPCASLPSRHLAETVRHPHTHALDRRWALFASRFTSGKSTKS